MLRVPSLSIPAVNARKIGKMLVVGTVLTGATALAGCGVPPELRQPGATVPAPSTPTPSTTPTTTAPVASVPTPTGASTPTFGELSTVDCAGNPSGAQVIALLRRSADLLPRGARVTVQIGPLCAGSWQYSVVQMPGREPLQVVSNGPATALKLVTAGTDVCNIPVRTGAPPGIRTAACEAGPPPTGSL